MKVTKDGSFVSLSPRLDDFVDAPAKGKKNKKKTTSYKGPDQNNHYPSYRIVFRDAPNDKQQSNTEQTGDSVDGSAEIEDVSLAPVASFLERGEGDERSIIIRQFGIQQSRRRVKTTAQKIDSYVKRRRHKLTVKENAPPSWQGILLLVLGLFGLLLSLLIGQFWEEATPSRRQSGPGARSRATPAMQGKRPRYGSSTQRKAY